ncbi:MAG: Gfo/Idh/MocA family oxidoreductase [Bacteroidota bacterium]
MSSADQPFAWGIVGCGWVVRDYVAPALAATGTVAALCDPDAEALAATAPGAAHYADLDAFLRHPGLDAVYVATPNHLHAAHVAAVAEAGLPVLCEKPMARTAVEAETMIEAVHRAGVPYATAFDQRFHPAHVALRRLVAHGALGTVTCVRIHYACWTPADWAPDALYRDNWRVDPERAGGGALIDLAPHGLDLTQLLLGEPIVEVAALTQERVFDYPVDDGAVLVGRTASGALLSHTVAYNCPDAFPRRRLEVIGTEARALAVNTMGQTPGGTLTLTHADGREEAVPFDAERSPFEAQAAAFVHAVRSGEPFPYGPERDLHTMRLLDAAVQSRPVRVDPEPVTA